MEQLSEIPEEAPIFWNYPQNFYFLLGMLGLLIAYYGWFLSFRKVTLTFNMPGCIPLPFIGNLRNMVLKKSPTELMQYMLEEAAKHGGIAKMFVGTRLAVGISDPRDLQVILEGQEHLEKSPEYNVLQSWLGDGLLVSKGDKWHTHRQMIAPAFHQSILKSYMPAFNDNARKLVQSLRQELGREFDVHKYMGNATMDILLETVLGLSRTTKGETESSDYATALIDMCNILYARLYKTWYGTEQTKLLNTLHSLGDKVFAIRKQEYFERLKQGYVSLYNKAVINAAQGNNVETSHDASHISALKDELIHNDQVLGDKKRLGLMDFMIEASQMKGNILSKTDIKNEVHNVMFGGHHTTTAASSFVLCLLGVHQDIQDRVHQELVEIFQKSDRPVTFQDAMSMEYLERVILETLRLYPPVPVIGKIVRDDVKLASGNYTIPKDSTVVIATYLTHRDPRYYPNPDQFNPDNFLPEKCQSRHHYSFIPFSAGPRSCVGREYAMLELKVLLATILRNFKVRSLVGEKGFQLQADIILKRTDGFRLVIEGRDS